MILVLFRMSFELGIIGAGNMGYAVAEGAIKSDAIPGRGRQIHFEFAICLDCRLDRIIK